MFKLKKRNFFAAILACLILCGCQKAPQSNTAENTFATGAIGNNGVHQTQTVPKEEKAIHREFTSTDGSVQFEMDIETDVAVSTLPVVKVQPHYLTVEDAQRVAYALFGNVDFYEREPYETATYSKAEIQNRLSNWSKYVSTEELRSLYGSEDNSFIQKLVRDYIQDYTLKMESASNDNPHVRCKWEFKEESRYTFSPDNIEAEQLADDNSAIMANCTQNDIRYCFDAVTRNKNDYKLNIISVYIDGSNSPFGIDEAIARASLCRTQKPEQTKIDTIAEKAKKILNEIALGQWELESCTLRTDMIGDTPEYSICINALPVLSGGKAVDSSPFFKLKGEDVYASNYYLTSAQIVFAPDGTLLSFELTSPIDIIEVSEQVNILNTSDEMINQGINRLSLTDCLAFYTGNSKDLDGIPTLCNVNITSGFYGLIRTKVINQENEYQYIPSFVLTGTYEISNKNTGEVYMYKDIPGILLALDAADGTVLIAPGA